MRQYIRRKIQILEQLGIRMTEDKIRHMRMLRNEIQIDNYARTIMKTAWDV